MAAFLGLRTLLKVGSVVGGGGVLVIFSGPGGGLGGFETMVGGEWCVVRLNRLVIDDFPVNKESVCVLYKAL